MNITVGESGGRPVKVDLENLLRTRLLIQANSGGGKSYCIRRLGEQLFGKLPVILIDPEGEFATLREKYGYVLVGAGGETPADARSAAMVAHKLLELHASAVCDLFEMKSTLRHQWLRLFLEALLDAPKKLWHPTVVIVDEAAMFCPEKGAGESEAAEAMISLATRGRKRGFCSVWATQRLGNLRKDAAAQLLNVLIGPTFIDIDRKRAAEQLGVSKDEMHDFMQLVKVLDPGNFYALGSAISKERILMKVGPVDTTHPETGSSRYSAAPPPAPESIKKLLPQLSDLPRQAEEKARTEAELRQEIRTLKSQLRQQPPAAPSEMPANTRKLEARCVRLRAALEEAMKVIATVNAAGFEGLEIKPEELQKMLDQIGAKLVTLAEGKFRERQQEFENLKRETNRTLIKLQKALEGEEVSVEVNVARREQFEIKPAVATPRAGFNPAPNGDLSGPEQRIIAALAQFEAIGRPSVRRPPLASLAGYSSKSTSFTNPLGSLNSKGLINYPVAGVVALTDAGREKTPKINAPLTTEELLDRVLKIVSGPEQRILKPLHAAYPKDMSRVELAASANYQPTSTSFTNPLGALRSAEMITYPEPGRVRAADWLFLE